MSDDDLDNISENDAPNLDDAVKQWLAKAATDWQTIEILADHPRCPRQAVCYHCQQYVEKLLKALLTQHQIEAPRTHDLRRLIQLASPHAPGLDVLADRADALSRAAIETRYPDNWREVSDSENARDDEPCRRSRQHPASSIASDDRLTQGTSNISHR